MDNQLLDSPLHNEAPNYAEYATFWQRFAASLIDGIILQVALTILMSIFGLSTTAFTELILSGEEEPDMIAFFTAMMPMYIMSMVIQILYYALLESSARQATFGKQALGIVVTDMQGQRLTFLRALGRYFAKFISAFTLLIGYIMQPFTAKKQALHDIMAGTLVFRKFN